MLFYKHLLRGYHVFEYFQKYFEVAMISFNILIISCLCFLNYADFISKSCFGKNY
jgi:hypothetical protein